MTSDDYQLFSQVIRRANQIMRAIDTLAPNDAAQAAFLARELRSALRTAQRTLGKIQLPTTPVPARWQGTPRPSQFAAVNGRSST